MPGEVGADSEDELVLDEASAAGTGAAPVPCKHKISGGKWQVQELALVSDWNIIELAGPDHRQTVDQVADRSEI